MSAIDDLAALQSSRRNGSNRSLLPSEPPGPGAAPEDLMGWLTVAFALGADPVADITRFGRHDDCRLVITTRAGRRIVFERQADVFSADILVRRVVLATAADVPSYQRGDAFKIAGALVRAADLACEDDDRSEARDWARTFLAAVTPLTAVDMSTPEGRFTGLVALRGWSHPDPQPWRTVAERSAVLPSIVGDLYIRVSDFAAHVRQMRGGSPLSWNALHTRLVEIGWDQAREYEQRRPRGYVDQERARPYVKVGRADPENASKAKLHIYRVPVGWDGEQ